MRHLLLAALLALPCLADDLSDERFAALVSLLASDDADQRAEADAILRNLDSAWKPRFEKALAAATDPEARLRLSELLAQCGRPRWRTDVETAFAEARAAGRPVLVLSTVGDVGGYA